MIIIIKYNDKLVVAIKNLIDTGVVIFFSRVITLQEFISLYPWHHTVLQFSGKKLVEAKQCYLQIFIYTHYTRAY